MGIVIVFILWCFQGDEIKAKLTYTRIEKTMYVDVYRVFEVQICMYFIYITIYRVKCIILSLYDLRKSFM